MNQNKKQQCTQYTPTNQPAPTTCKHTNDGASSNSTKTPQTTTTTTRNNNRQTKIAKHSQVHFPTPPKPLPSKTLPIQDKHHGSHPQNKPCLQSTHEDLSDFSHGSINSNQFCLHDVSFVKNGKRHGAMFAKLQIWETIKNACCHL